MELGFESLEREATEEDLRALVASAGDAPRIHVILSANVFVAPLRAIAMARAASDRVTVRPSSRDPTLARALLAAAADPAVSLAVDTPADADRIDVYGRDETIARVRADVRAGTRAGTVIRGHGAGLGVACVARGDAVDAAAASLAADVVPFDQRGCLSPRIAFVEGPSERGESFARALHDQLIDVGARIPRGELSPSERSEAVRWREALTFAGRVWSGADHAVAVAASEMPLAVPPGGRHVLIVPVPSASAARAALAPIAPFVIIAAGLEASAVAPPHARLAVLGRMQRPPLDGPVDRRGL